ncbi:MAG TPA: UvrD-helicase domain-containing protein [Planctomycetota bacterium]|nr:UvrD-helicase domain-containing protein [Planctomycetota bacterium]
MTSPTIHPDSLLEGLNPAQREAVTTTQGPLLVLAGAGTGKTRVITHRIAHILSRGTPPEAVLAVTFTNKAAREMRERVGGILGKKPRETTISTFHSLGVRILRKDAGALGYRPNFGIHDSSDQLSLVRTALRDIRGAAAAVDPRAVLSAISRAKNAFQLPEDLLEAAADDFEQLTALCYRRYQDDLLAMNCVDFDDLILLPVLCFRKDEGLRKKYQLRFRFVLVDEYQDTNGAQYQFLLHIVGPERNLCVVGDDDQSIYGFRGAEMEKILGFERDFPGARVVKLEENYRSTGSILSLANAVIRGNASRREKTLRSTLGEGAAVRWVVAPDENAEVDHVLRGITSLMERDRVAPAAIGVLFRAAIQARPFEEKLRLRKIPYTLVGGQSYFDRKEVRDVIAYWKVAANPRDDLSLLRIVNVPRRGLGTATLARLDELARASKVPLLEAFGAVARGEGDFTPSVRTAARHVHELFGRARERLERKECALMARALIEEGSYREAVNELYPDPTVRQARWGAIESLLASVEGWERANPDTPFSSFLEAISLDKEDTRKEDGGERRGLTLMTLHGAKGLEFPHVWLVGVEDDLLPHKKALLEGDRGLEEERRLFYVGITRARETLTLTSAAARTLYGQPRPRAPSRFILEVAAAGLLEREEYSGSIQPTESEVEDYLALYRKQRTR